MSGESFWTDKWHIKLLSEFFPNSHSTFYEWLRSQKIHEWFWGDVYDLGKVSETMTFSDMVVEWMCSHEHFWNHDSVTDQNYWWIFFQSVGHFPIHIQDFMSDSSKNNNLHFENSLMDMRGCYELGKVSETMTSDR